MADKVPSISAKDLNAKVNVAVEATLARHKKITRIGGVVISPELLGFILREAELHERTIGEVGEIAGDVAKQLNGKKPSVIWKGDKILLGFVPDFDVLSVVE